MIEYWGGGGGGVHGYLCVQCTCQLEKGVTFVSGLVNQVKFLGLVCSFVTSVFKYLVAHSLALNCLDQYLSRETKFYCFKGSAM